MVSWLVHSFVRSTPSMMLRAVLLWELERRVPDGDHVQSASHIKHSLPCVPPAPPSHPSPLSGRLPGLGFLAPRSQRHQRVWVLVSGSWVLEAAVTLLPDPWVTSLLSHLPAGSPPCWSPPRCTPLNSAGGGLPIPHLPGLGPCWWVPQSWISGPLLSFHQVFL